MSHIYICLHRDKIQYLCLERFIFVTQLTFHIVAHTIFHNSQKRDGWPHFYQIYTYLHTYIYIYNSSLIQLKQTHRSKFRENSRLKINQKFRVSRVLSDHVTNIYRAGCKQSLYDVELLNITH